MARDDGRVFTSLVHLIDVPLLRASFARLRKKVSAGIDGRTKEEYSEDLESNLAELHLRLREKRYRATPARRVRIAKESGGERVLSIPALEDKIVQGAASLLLQSIYEPVFYGFSYGFRQGRSPHEALEALWRELQRMGGGWIIDADIHGYFDHVPHGQLKEVLQRRVNDGGLLRLIGKWLKTGCVEGGMTFHPETGVPQGGVISPVLSNIYLHEVLDDWYAREVRPRLRGRSFLIRFADDFLICCELEHDARRVLDVLAKRLAVYGLQLHPEKTRLLCFKRPPREGGPGGEGTFEFLGFTHHWGRSRRGKWTVQRRTSARRSSRALSALEEWCKRNRHLPLHEQSQRLSLKLLGHYSYFGIKGNYACLRRFYRRCQRLWHKWLSRRGGRRLTWPRLKATKSFQRLPRPRLVHSRIQLTLSGQ
jgi:group II intron reverse transcriptase/maturase